MDRQEFLMHKGVKGMKWGRRKAVDSGSSSRNASPSKDLDVKAEDQEAKIQAAKRLAMRRSTATLAGIGTLAVASQAGAHPVIAYASGIAVAAILDRPRKSDRDKALK